MDSSLYSIASTANVSRILQNSTLSEVDSKYEEQPTNESTPNEKATEENNESPQAADQTIIPPQSKVMDDDDDESSSFSVLILLFALAVMGYLIRKRLMSNSMNSGRWIAGAMPLPTEDFDEDEMIHYRKQEM